jgi:hypothetical protein
MPNAIVRASATALPNSTLPRRGFLRQLCHLPLIGGGAALLGVPTAVAEPAPAAMPFAVDPVYAAIAEHKRALAAFTAICSKLQDVDDDDLTDEQNAEYQAAEKAEKDALEAVANTVPTTREGAIEALRTACSDPVNGRPIGLFMVTLLNVAFPSVMAEV